jgi:hypothetical protein
MSVDFDIDKLVEQFRDREDDYIYEDDPYHPDHVDIDLEDQEDQED